MVELRVVCFHVILPCLFLAVFASDSSPLPFLNILLFIDPSSALCLRCPPILSVFLFPMSEVLFVFLLLSSFTILFRPHHVQQQEKEDQELGPRGGRSV